MLAQEANTADSVIPATDEDDESIDDVDLEGIFTIGNTSKNVVEAHKWVVKKTNKKTTLCVGLTKGNTSAFHKMNKLNGPSWQMTFRNHNGPENEGFPMKNGRPKYDALCAGWYWKAADFPIGAIDANWNELRRFAKKGSSMKLIFFEHDITKKSEFMDMKQFLNYDPSASAADPGFSFKH